MIDSSFITSPLSPEFSDVWSEPELLSAKGHNAIYVATRFGRRYVLKALAEPFRESTPYIEMLRKEFSIGVGLDHPNIVRLLDFGHMDAIGWYIQMEYVEGITLEQFLETKPSKSVRLKIIHQLLDALSFLHERQIIHRDIKPSNILITRNGSAVKLIDFGVSDTDDYVTFKQPAGSMAYIAPEQLAGKTIDNRADIFAFGRILQLVFPHRYGCVVRRCTRVEPSRRYSSCPRVACAMRNIDRIRTWSPLLLLILLITGVAIWGTFATYQLNRVVDSLTIKANTPSPQEVVRQKAAVIHQIRMEAIREAVKSGEIKTQKQMRDFDGGIKENVVKTEQSITDPILLEEFRQAYMNYWNLYDQLYDSLALILPEE